jgi:hypothetical protein
VWHEAVWRPADHPASASTIMGDLATEPGSFEELNQDNSKALFRLEKVHPLFATLVTD